MAQPRNLDLWEGTEVMSSNPSDYKIYFMCSWVGFLGHTRDI